MRESRKRAFPRKLSSLASEELGIHIQQQQQQQKRQESASSGVAEEDGALLLANNAVGHSSVEDAAAALRLYWHRSVEWERSLGHPLRTEQTNGRRRIPLRMYLDGCNLPIGCRGVDFHALMTTTTTTTTGEGGDAGGDCGVGRDGDDEDATIVTTISTKDFRLTSRVRDGGSSNHQHSSSSNISIIDWMPIFRSALSSPRSALGGITVMFDGAKYGSGRKNGNVGGGARGGGGVDTSTRRFRMDPASSSGAASDRGRGSIEIEITADGEEADDVLVRTVSRCGEDEVGGGGASAPDPDAARKGGRVISLEEAIDILSDGGDDCAETDSLPYYVVIRRKAGGTKTHRRLFDRLHLRRPDEGAVCLSSLTAGLRRGSLRIARELQREKSIERVIECERRDRDELRFVVVTEDVYLTDRLVRGNGVLVLSYTQLTTMW